MAADENLEVGTRVRLIDVPHYDEEVEADLNRVGTVKAIRRKDTGDNALVSVLLDGDDGLSCCFARQLEIISA